MKTTRLTMAQALVRFLDAQYVEWEGVESRFVRGVIGIFGHGNVVGLGEALAAHGHGLVYYQGHNEQGAAHLATGLRKAVPPAAHPGSDQLHRPRRAEHGDRGRDSHGEPNPPPPAPRGRLCQQAARSRSPAGGAVERPRRHGERRFPRREPLLGQDHPARADHERLHRGHARAHRPGGNGSGDHRPSTGCPGRGIRLSRRVLREARPSPGQEDADSGRRETRRRPHPLPGAAAAHLRRRRALLRGRPGTRGVLRSARHSVCRDAGGEGGPAVGPPAEPRGHRGDRRPCGKPLRARGGPGDRRGHAARRFHDRLQGDLRGPGRRGALHQREPLRRAQDECSLRGRRRP